MSFRIWASGCKIYNFLVKLSAVEGSRGPVVQFFCNGIAEKSGPATKKRQKSIQETRIPYTTWKVDGATPSLGLSWPLTNRHLLGVVSHLLSLRCTCFLLSNFRWCRCVQENDILVGTCLGWVRKCFKSLLIDPYPYSGSQNEWVKKHDWNTQIWIL